MDREIQKARDQAEEAWEAMERAASEVNSLETALYRLRGTEAEDIAEGFDNDVTGIQQRMGTFVDVLGDLLESLDDL